tara:strand:- start:829 stop:1011 length:183 start_codon:yes stop_codon:yes gene_type:complete
VGDFEGWRITSFTASADPSFIFTTMTVNAFASLQYLLKFLYSGYQPQTGPEILQNGKENN